MWRVYWRKAKADFRSRPLQSALLAAVIIAASGTLTLALLVQRSTGRSFEDFLADAGGGHAWIFSSKERLAQIATGSDVVAAGYPLAALDGGRSLSTAEAYRLSFFAYTGGDPEVVPGVLTKGRWPAPGTAEAVLDRGLAADAGLEVGDTIRVAARGGAAELTVVGLAVPTSRAPYPIWDYARVFVADEQLISLGGGSAAYYAAGYVLADPGQAPAFVEHILAGPAKPGGRAWQTIRDSVVEENDPTYILLGVFASFALVASVFIIANAIAGQVQAQQRDIGLLRAAGMTPGQVGLLLVIELVALAGLASVVGVVAGWLLAPLFLGSVDRWLGTSATVSPAPLHTLLTVGGTAALAAVAAVIPAARAGRTSTVRAIREGGAPSRAGVSRAARVAAAVGLPPSLVIGTKDLFRHRLQAWLLVSAVAVAAAAVIATITIEQTLNSALDDPALLGLVPFHLQMEPLANTEEADSAVTAAGISPEEIGSLLDSEPRVTAVAPVAWVQYLIDGHPYGGYALGGDYREFGYVFEAGRMMEPGGEAAIEVAVGLGLARKLGLRVGDSGTFTLDRARQAVQRFEVVGVYLEDDNDGQMMMFALEDMQRLIPGLEPFAFGLELAEGAPRDTVAASLVDASGGRVVVVNPFLRAEDDVRRIRAVIRPIMLTLSGFLIGMVSVSLFSTLILSVRERRREIGILKAVGFTPGQVVASVMANAVVLAGIGAVVGAPAGWLFTRFVFGKSASDGGYDAGALVATPTAAWFVALFAAAVLVAALGSALPARFAARLRVSEALRYE